MPTPHEPLWTLDQLGERVVAALAEGYSGQPNGRVSDLPNKRTIRYYTTLGLLGRPVWWRGRQALYTLRHLLQLVAIKRLQAEGLSLAEIQVRLLGVTDAALWKISKLRPDFEFLELEQSQSTANSASKDAPENERRAECFWHTAASAPHPDAPGLVSVPLEATVMLVFKGRQPLDELERSALHLAAAPLLKFLHIRRLVGGEEV